MTDTPAPQRRRSDAARAPAPPDLLTELLGAVGRQFSPDPASALSEMLLGLRVRAAFLRGVYPPRGKVTDPSPVALAAADAIEKAVCFYLAAGGAAASPNVLPAGLEKQDGQLGEGLQMTGSLPQDEITLDEAAVVLGLSGERVRQLVRAGEIDGWQDGTGHRKWHLIRDSVIAYERGGHGPGGTARRSA